MRLLLVSLNVYRPMGQREIADMKLQWERRGASNPFFYVETQHWDGNLDAFFALGEERSRLFLDPMLRESFGETSTLAAVEIGCGTGRFSRALGQRFARVEAVDISESMVEEARRVSTLPNVTFRASDGVSLPVEDQSVDFAFSYEVFQHMPTHAVMALNLAETRRVLKPGGRALIHFRTGQPEPRLSLAIYLLLPTRLVAMLKRLLGKDPLTSDLAWHGAPPLSLGDIRDMCASAGLSVAGFRPDPTHAEGTRIFAELVRTAA
jgi:ubiquinone/menaquinone biosynthesis C-methylase UbiE